MSDSASFRKFDYSLRPAKNIERKMLAEMFGRLSVFRPTTDYEYVGFGSVYFTDYALFHRQLGLTPMYSMESDLEGIARAEFNVPFGCVKVVAGKSSECLPGMAFDRPTIVWLDYDFELCELVLQDVRTVVSKQCEQGDSGVIVLASVDAESKRLLRPKSVPEDELEDWPEEPIDQFQRLVGAHNTPADLSIAHLRGDKLAETYRKVYSTAIQSVVTDYPGWNYQQLANFRYADGAEMATFGGILFESSQSSLLEQAAFHRLDFVQGGDAFYRVAAPRLTFREIHALAGCVELGECPPNIPIRASDFEDFKRVYRYFPAFVEAEL